MIYEMNTVTLKPGSVVEFERLFGEALPHRQKHSRLGAFWHTEIGPLNQVIYVWPYEDLAHRAQVSSTAEQESHWPPPVQELVVSQESEVLSPAPFMRPLESGEMGGVYELRIYTFKAGTIPEVLKRWADVLESREKYSPLAACWYTEVGKLNRFFHVWPYKDLAHRGQARAAAAQDPNWPPKTREFAVSQENKLMVPAAFSPLK